MTFITNLLKKFWWWIGFTDTDSLTCEINSEDVYEEIFKYTYLLGFNYLKDSNFFDPTNEKIIDKMKDSSEVKILDNFGGLRSKMYSMKILMVKNLIQKRSKYCDWV